MTITIGQSSYTLSIQQTEQFPRYHIHSPTESSLSRGPEELLLNGRGLGIERLVRADTLFLIAVLFLNAFKIVFFTDNVFFGFFVESQVI